jgi:putative flippase GtrA
MRANSCEPNAVRDVRVHDPKPESWQLIGGTEVMPESAGKNAGKRDDSAAANLANSKPGNGMRTVGGRRTNQNSRNSLAVNDLRGIDVLESGEQAEKNCNSLIAPSTLVRWCKFNVVGGMGILVQFAALFFLRSVMHFNYLFATAIAVEAAVVHNFVWHEQFTWADRVQPRAEPSHTSGAEAQNLLSGIFAALKRCATQRLWFEKLRFEAEFLQRWRAEMTSLYGPSFRRLLRFNLSNGAVSILGNLALMKVMVGQGHMNYLLANAIAIALCSLANFLVSDEWVFERE